MTSAKAPNLVFLPESFIALRKELAENHKETIWPKVSYAMMYDKVFFLEIMNQWAGVSVPADCDIAKMSKTYLDAAFALRGITPMFPPSEKYGKIWHA